MTTTPILQPGRNCWRIEHARRAAFLVDAADYFSAVASAIERAQRSILILGWDIDSRTALRQGRDGSPAHFGDFLNDIVSKRKGLRAHLLGWDFAMIYALEREPLPVYKLDWRTHPKIRFRLDASHPVGASHHQKIVVVDDAVAFSGGLDLTIRRWDTQQHLAHDPHRVDPDGKPYLPFHDIQMAVDGEAAKAIAALARERWVRATGNKLIPPQHISSDPWPPELVPDVTDIPVAVSRTLPGYKHYPEVREVEALFLDSIAAATQYIYIENQYFTAGRIGDALIAKLQQEQGPEIIAILRHETSGWLEASTMGVLRARLLRRIRAADRFKRFQAYCPMVPGLAKSINVHSKVMIIDDCFLRIGSANLNNRSMGLDTECDLASKSDEPRVKTAFSSFLNRLLAEHLGTSTEQVAHARAAKKSIIGAIESLRGNPKTLEELSGEVEEWLDALIPSNASLLDPERPVKLDQLVENFVPDLVPPKKRRPFIRTLTVAAALVLLSGVWYLTPLKEWLSLQQLSAWAQLTKETPMAPVIIIGAYVLGGLILMPVTVLILATALIFSPWLAFVYALGGCLASGTVGYSLGRLLGRDTIRRIAGFRLNRIGHQLARHGIITVITIRMLPVAPFTVVNLAVGASYIQFHHFLLGTLLGMSPGILAITAYKNALSEIIINPGVPSTLFLIALTAVIALIFKWTRGRLRDRANDGHDRAATTRRHG